MSLAESFAQNSFAHFINSPAGRVVRILAGLVLIVWGVYPTYGHLRHHSHSDWLGPIIGWSLQPLFDQCVIGRSNKWSRGYEDQTSIAQRSNNHCYKYWFLLCGKRN